MKSTATARWLFLGWVLFVVYGSLVPLEFKALPLDVALERFQHIRFYKLGLESRADWVANGVLYLPVGFLGVRVLVSAGLPALLAAALASGFGCVLAVGVEFTQLYFPGRTVSQNDILAECIGSVLGAAVAPLFSTWIDRLGAAWRSGGARLLPRLLELYAVAYVGLSFFPYDLLLSAAEISDKWDSKGWGWIFAPNERGLFFTALQWTVEVLVVMPIGALPVFQRRGGAVGAAGAGSPRVALALLAGAALGLFIEVGQFFVATTVSQGASIVSRALGVAAGAVMLGWLQQAGLQGLRAALRPLAPWLWPLYLPLVAAVNGAFRLPRHGLQAALESLHTTHWLPFYYHYFTTEALALFSLTNVALMYLPIAVLVWVRGGPARLAVALAVAVSSAAEIGKLFLQGTHADPTNVLVAAAANALLMGLLALAGRPAPMAAAATGADAMQPSATATAAPTLWLAVVPVALGAALLFPVFQLLLAALLVVAALLVWRWPLLALAIVPVALPVLDWAPWSGRFFIDEFDWLQAVVLAVALQRTQPAPRQALRLGLTAAFALLALSLACSTLRSLLTMPALGDSALSHYYSAFNGLRIVKGAAWAWLYLVVWRRLQPQGQRRAQALAGGMALGLALTVGFVLAERVVFAGPLDFAADYRVTGPFSTMHKGGAYIECFLAVAAAFAVNTVLRPGPVALRAGALLLLAGAGYAMLVTYSRNGYAALAVVVLVSLLAQLPGCLRRPAEGGARTFGLTQAAFALALLLVVAAAAVPLAGGYAKQRLSQSGKDLGVRQAHWADGLAMRDSGAATALIGMGLGRFPERHFWDSRETLRAATYGLGHEHDTHFLRLGQGARLYIEQIVPRPAVGALKLSFDWRGAPGQAGPEVVICEKWTLTSLNCSPVVAAPTMGADVPPQPPADAAASAPAAAAAASAAPPATAASAAAQRAKRPWSHAELALDASRLAASGFIHAPFKLALFTPKVGAFEITNVRLRSALGDELLANGDFSQGMDRWFFATDVDPPWHLHSLPVAVLFDQGWLGVLAWGAVFAVALGSGAVLLWRGQALVPAAFAAVMGFAVSGSLNTLIDAPRFLWLLLVLLALAAASTVNTPPAAAPPPGRRSGPRRDPGRKP